MMGPAFLTANIDSATVGSTETTFGLVYSGDTDNTPSAVVYGASFYTSDPSAIFKVTVERVEQFSGSDSGSGRPHRDASGNRSGGTLAFSQLTSPSGIQRISHHVVTLNSPLHLEFNEPIEVQRDYSSSTDHFFALAATRLDSSSGATVFANVHYTQYAG